MPGKAAAEDAIVDAIQNGTMYTAGEVTFVTRLEDLPDEVR